MIKYLHMHSRIVLSLVAMLVTTVTPAQQAPLDANQPMVAPLVSPEVHADRSISFRISAPTAPGVQLRFDGKDYPMTKGERDPRAPHQKQAYEDFKRDGVDLMFKTYPGGHDMNAFRPAMAEFAMMIFK